MIQTFALCWDGNADAMIGYMPNLYLTRVFDVVSLKLFYNYGRLPMVFWGNGRVSNCQLRHDKDWIVTEQGYHCKFCGKLLKNPRDRKFCPTTNCESEYWRLFVQYDCWAYFRDKVFKRDNFKCAMCGHTSSTLICDHIFPLFKGGRDWWQDPERTNFQTLCEECNKIKTTHDMAKPKKIKARYNIQKIQYLGWVFEKNVAVDHPLDKFLKEIPVE